MAISLPASVKKFATTPDTAGVPLGDLETIVGTLVERHRHTETITDVSTGATAVRVNYKPLQFATEYRIQITDSAGVVQLNGTINALTWQGLVHADAGDTLVHDGQNTQTGHSLAPPDGDPAIPTTIVVGRTEANFMLLQGIALTDQAILEVFSTEFSGGAIEERSWRQTAAAPHVVRLKILTTAVAEAPPDLGYDGSFATGLDGTGWVEIDEPFPDPSLSGATVYQLRADAVYNPLAGRWLISNIEIFSPEGGVSVEFATSDTGPWHAEQAADDQWRRWRDSLLYWHVEPLNELDDGWRFLVSFEWNSDADSDPGVYYIWNKALSFDIDFDDWKHVLLTWSWGTSGRESHIHVPTPVLRSQANNVGSFASGTGRVAHFRKNANGAPYDDAQQNAPRTDNDHSRGFQYAFLRNPTASDRRANYFRIDAFGTAIVGIFRAYVGR